MAIMGNKWIEKEASKHSILKTTAPSYQPHSVDDYAIENVTKKRDRHSKATRANMVNTLRGVRK